MSGTLFCQWHQFLWKSLLISSLTHALQKVRIQVSKIHLLFTHKVKVTLKWKLQGMFVVRKYRNMLTKDFSQRSEIGTFKNICLKRLWKVHFFPSLYFQSYQLCHYGEFWIQWLVSLCEGYVTIQREDGRVTTEGRDWNDTASFPPSSLGIPILACLTTVFWSR